MDADPRALIGPGREFDQESFIREIASLRTYLMFVAGTFEGVDSLPGRGVSDLVHSVLGDAFAKVRDGDVRFTFQSDQELKSWLVKRLRWTYWDYSQDRSRYERILQGLPPGPSPRNPESELVLKERAELLAEARAKLEPADRQLIEWRVDEGLTYEEIGRRRGYTASYARRACLDVLQILGSVYLSIGGSPPT
jgi:RNA polymerase sigma factor (sigma-70 family)